jgi:hypothetical protein
MSNWNPEPGGSVPGSSDQQGEQGWQEQPTTSWSPPAPGWSAPGSSDWAPHAGAGLPPQPATAQPGWSPPAAAGLPPQAWPPQPAPAQPGWDQPVAAGWNAPAPGWSPQQQAPGGYLQPYQAAGYPQPMPGQAGGNGLAVASLVLGITSIMFCWWGLLSLAQVVLAGVFGVFAINKANSGLAGGKSLAIAGLICGVVGFIAYFFVGIATLGIGFII